MLLQYSASFAVELSTYVDKTIMLLLKRLVSWKTMPVCAQPLLPVALQLLARITPAGSPECLEVELNAISAFALPLLFLTISDILADRAFLC